MEMHNERTRDEIEALKRDWANDPAWDIEHTEGFEAHYWELRSFRTRREEERAAARQLTHEIKAESLGVPGSIQLAECILALEERIASLEAALARLQNE